MSTSHVWAPHDDGTWRLAQLLDQYRGPDGWGLASRESRPGGGLGQVGASPSRRQTIRSSPSTAPLLAINRV
jgi:hypothetical protein